jgi:predicted transcriptional regulator YdeE
VGNFIFAAEPKHKDKMNYKTEELAGFKVIGIEVRTTNQNGKARTDIAELWGKFMSQNLIVQIPNKENSEIYCIYTDYESDYLGAYTTILGCRVSILENIPKGFIARDFPATKYQIYTSKGKLPDCVGNTWMQIWKAEIDRKYTLDFDVYGQKSQDPQNAEVEIFISAN